MKLVLRQEGEPVDSFLLVLAQFCLDLYREYVLFDLAAVQKLCQELAFLVPPPKEFLRETGGVRQTGLDGVGEMPGKLQLLLTSRGTILTREAKVLVAVDRMSSSGSLILPKTGTTKKMTYGNALTSNF